MPAWDLNETETRALLIDPQLEKVGWRLGDRTQVLREIPVDGYDAEPWNGVTDYCLYNTDGSVLAVVEAKRCSRKPRVAEEQLRHYVTEIAKHQSHSPFGFMANVSPDYFRYDAARCRHGKCGVIRVDRCDPWSKLFLENHSDRPPFTPLPPVKPALATLSIPSKTKPRR